MHLTDREATWLATADRLGKVTKTALLQRIETWIRVHRPLLVIIDSNHLIQKSEIVATIPSHSAKRKQIYFFSSRYT